MKTILKQQKNKQYTIGIICNAFNINREAFYKYKRCFLYL